MMMGLIIRRQCSTVLPSSSVLSALTAALWSPDQQHKVHFCNSDQRHYYNNGVTFDDRVLSNGNRRYKFHSRGIASSEVSGDETPRWSHGHQVSELHQEMRQVFGSNLPEEIDTDTIKNNSNSDDGETATPGVGRVSGFPVSHQEEGTASFRFKTASINHPHSGNITSSSNQLTHTDGQGKARMVDVSDKIASSRSATASARVLLGRETFELVAQNQMGKGDVLTVSKLAGIMGAKHTSTLIPLCHPILLSDVDVSLRLESKDDSVEVVATASTVGPTGVEMEALTAASVAALTVYDMCKASSKGIVITDVKLEEKKGGKSGHWVRVI